MWDFIDRWLNFTPITNQAYTYEEYPRDFASHFDSDGRYDMREWIDKFSSNDDSDIDNADSSPRAYTSHG